MYDAPVQSIDDEDVKGFMEKPIKYKLLKDLHVPMDEGYINIFPVGSVFEKRGNEYVSQSIDMRNGKSHDHWMDSTTIENNTEFFTPLIESEPEMLEEPKITIGLLDPDKKYVYADRSLEMWISKVTRAINALRERTK